MPTSPNKHETARAVLPDAYAEALAPGGCVVLSDRVPVPLERDCVMIVGIARVR